MALKGDSKTSTINEGSVFEGNFYINGALQIAGKFEGTIKTNDHVIIMETGKVKTNINAKRVTVGGTLIGNIKAKEEVLITNTGRCIGNITTPVLNLQKGALTKGDINITAGQKLDVGKIVKDSYASTPGFDSLAGAEKGKRTRKSK